MTAQHILFEDDGLAGRLTLSVEEAGRALGVSRTSAYKAVRAGDIPSIRIGHRLLVPAAGLRRLLGES